MDWIRFDITCTNDSKDALIPELIDMEISGFEIKDGEPFDELLSGRLGNWDYVGSELIKPSDDKAVVTFYIPYDEKATETSQMLTAMLKKLESEDRTRCYEMEFTQVNDEDWANNWKEYFKPLEIGQKLLIKPSWEDIPENRGQRTILEIDPATAFGTGQHDTTRLCLELIEKYTGRGERVLDLGCGSGILSIAAMLLGAQSAAAVDIDENSSVIALENAMQNGISPEFYKTFFGDITQCRYLIEEIGSGFDVAIANIVADVLIKMSDIFGKFLKAQGILIVSGIINERKNDVFKSLEDNGFELCEEISSDEWTAAVFKRKLP